MNSTVARRPKLATGCNGTFSAVSIAVESCKKCFDVVIMVPSTPCFRIRSVAVATFSFHKNATETRRKEEKKIDLNHNNDDESDCTALLHFTKVSRKRNSRVFLSHLNCGWRCNKKHLRSLLSESSSLSIEMNEKNLSSKSSATEVDHFKPCFSFSLFMMNNYDEIRERRLADCVDPSPLARVNEMLGELISSRGISLWFNFSCSPHYMECHWPDRCYMCDGKWGEQTKSMFRAVVITHERIRISMFGN